MEADFKNRIAEEIADEYYQDDDGLIQIYRIRSLSMEDDPYEPVKILEVNLDAIPEGIAPIRFDSEDFSYITMEVTVNEFQKLLNKELSLPNDWFLAEPITRNESNWDPDARSELTDLFAKQIEEDQL